MNTHVVGGGLGTLLGTLITEILSRYTSLHISDVDAAVIGSAFVGAGVGLAHGVSVYGLSGLLRRVLHGTPAVPVQTPPPPPETKA